MGRLGGPVFRSPGRIQLAGKGKDRISAMRPNRGQRAAQDLQDVAEVYGLTALQGNMSAIFVEK